MRPTALALLGIGKIARDQHIPAIAANAAFKLVATVDPVAGLGGVPNFPSIEALLTDGPAIDAVSICTPPQVRGAIARASIAAGKATMLEKPPAATVSVFNDLVSRAAAKTTPLFAAWHARFSPMVPAARAFLADKRIASGRLTWRESARKWHPGQKWLWAPGGFGIFDPTINAFSILTLITQDAISVTQARFETPSNCAAPIAAEMKLRCGDGIIDVDVDFRETEGEKWEIELTTVCGRRMLLSRGGEALSIDGAPAGSAPKVAYPAIYARFAELIARAASDADGAPLQLVADAFLLAEIRPTAPYYD